mgnify:CR=1 FL=1
MTEALIILPEMIFLLSKICLSMIFLKLRNLLALTVSHRFPIIMQLRKKELMYNKNVSEKVQALSSRMEQARDVEGFFTAVTVILQRLRCWHVWSEQSVPYPGSYRQQTCIFTDQQYGQSYAV